MCREVARAGETDEMLSKLTKVDVVHCMLLEGIVHVSDKELDFCLGLLLFRLVDLGKLDADVVEGRGP